MSTPSNAAVTITPPDNHVLMIAPRLVPAEAAYVPPDQVASYEAKGAKVGVRMTAPDVREKAIVPFDQQGFLPESKARRGMLTPTTMRSKTSWRSASSRRKRIRSAARTQTCLGR